MVEWVDDLIRNPPAASDSAVSQAEQALGVRFPPDFLAVARVRQGARPEPSRLQLADGSGTAVEHLLHFESSPGHSNIAARRFAVEDVMEPQVIPFAEASGGDLFCFDYREDPQQPKVVYWVHDDDVPLIPVANSFDAFTTKLHDD